MLDFGKTILTLKQKGQSIDCPFCFNKVDNAE